MSTYLKTHCFCIAAALVVLSAGCQCCPLFDHYAGVIDDVSDKHVYFDQFYNPKLDITRMGKPDWCSPFNRHFCPRCCNNGCYDRYDECHLYPPQYPFEFPSNVMPPPSVRTKRIPARIDPDESDSPNSLNSPPAPVPAYRQ